MSVATVRAVLVAAVPVTTLVPADRIEALRRTQSFAIPAITLEDFTTPLNHLRGHAGLDQNEVTVTYLAATYTLAKQLAAAGRTALYAAGFVCTNEFPRNEPETDPELFQIAQTWSVFT